MSPPTIFEVFDDKTCSPVPNVTQSAFQGWFIKAPIYNMCTVFAEISIFIVCCLISFIILTLYWRRQRKTQYQLSKPKIVLSFIAVPILVYVLLIIIGIIAFPSIITSIMLNSPTVICFPKANKEIQQYTTEAYKIESGGSKIAILKIKRKENGRYASKKVTVLYTYGKEDSLLEELGNLTKIAKAGFEVFGWDLPGFGSSEGNNEPDAIIQAHGKVLEFVANNTNKRKEEIVIWGHSMGGAISTIGANNAKSNKLILHNPLDSVELVAKDGCRMLGWVFGPLRLQNVLNAKSVMKSYAASGGCLLMYSTEKDQLIPYERQLELFAEFNRTATCRKSFLETNEYQVHDRSPWVDDQFNQTLEKFL